MTHKNISAQLAALVGALSLAMPWLVHAQATASDDFTKASDPNSWKTFGGACLTAGDGTGSIPSCVGLTYYQNQIQVGGNKGYLGQTTAPASGAAGVQALDPAGSGALRLTNGYTAGKTGFMYGYSQAGAIISSGAAFNNSAGVNIIFKTITYLGNSGNGDGADGMGFFLMDGSKSPYDVGAFGGSLGYSCSNTNNDSTVRADGSVRGYDGLAYGYLGLGMDEYGNFLNAADNTVTGPNQTPGRIGLRGAGNISWAQLYAANPSYYPTASYSGTANLAAGDAKLANRAAAVQKVCSTGKLWDYSSDPTDPTGRATIPDYGAISGGSVILSSILPGKLIAAESATIRTGTTGAATPITYNLKITQNGLLSLSMAYGNGAYIPVITKQDITASNGIPPATFRFGFAGSTGGSNNVHEVLCFQAAPVNVAGTSVGVNQKEATKVASGTQAYLANYYPNDWTGRLTASNILYDSSTKTISISATSNWDAQCNLTGILAGATNACPTTGTTGPVAAQAPLGGGATSSSAPLNRSLITWSGSAGVAFEWSGSTGITPITTAQKTTLTQGDATSTANRLNYLRGDRTNEINTLGAGLFRGRNGVLGDIIDSSPTWVGAPSSAYSAVWVDKIQSAGTITENSGTQNYSAFITAQQTRLNVVYDGANDGFLHAFRSGSYDTSGNYVTTLNDGQEILAYMPGLVLQNIHNSTDATQDYSNAAYSHNYFVNATPGTGDLFYNGQWHSWLAGGLGAGGAGLYILDVTSPSTFSEANAGSIVIGDWTSSTISCATSCGSHLGSTYGTPVIRRLHDGKWGVIFGNGFGSTACDAGIYVMTVNPTTGAIANTYYLGTGTGTCSNPNGIAYVTPVDIDTDHIVDYVYAGDLLGNVWRFDLTSTSESSWGTTSGSPLFSTSVVASGQPITSKLLVAIQPQTTGLPRLMVEFGTGRKFPLTNTSPVSYAPGTQYLYGIWDWNMASWNGLSTTKLASLTAPQTIAATNLTTQTLTLQASGILDGSSNTICWAGSTACTSGNTQFGFSIALPGANEQVVYSPLLFQNAFLVNTTIPAVNSPTSCLITQDGGNTIAISVASGGAIPGFFKNTTDTNASGTSTGGTGTPFMLQAGGQSYMLTQTNSACTGSSCPSNPIFSCKTNPNAAYCTTSTSTATPTGKRLTWIERR
jgi:type IV pilus assembly protein PilY1